MFINIWRKIIENSSYLSPINPGMCTRQELQLSLNIIFILNPMYFPGRDKEEVSPAKYTLKDWGFQHHELLNFAKSWVRSFLVIGSPVISGGGPVGHRRWRKRKFRYLRPLRRRNREGVLLTLNVSIYFRGFPMPTESSATKSEQITV